MKALFRKNKISSLEDLKDAALGEERVCAGDIAWMVVGGLVVLTGLFLLVQEIPAMVRELRIMRM